MSRWLSGLTAVLAVFWLTLSGHYTQLLLALGLASVILVAWIARRMDIVDHEGVPLHISIGVPLYWGWLLAQILLTGVTVARMAWSPRIRLNPNIRPTPTHAMSDLDRVIYANSITLTPGTLSLETGDDAIEVHGLNEALQADLAGGAMKRRVDQLET
ncbi:MAG: Na+/H+ antiporter subunit E [Panacagrimonas sp.]